MPSPRVDRAFNDSLSTENTISFEGAPSVIAQVRFKFTKGSTKKVFLTGRGIDVWRNSVHKFCCPSLVAEGFSLVSLFRNPVLHVRLLHASIALWSQLLTRSRSDMSRVQSLPARFQSDVQFQFDANSDMEVRLFESEISKYSLLLGAHTRVCQACVRSSENEYQSYNFDSFVCFHRDFKAHDTMGIGHTNCEMFLALQQLQKVHL